MNKFSIIYNFFLSDKKQIVRYSIALLCCVVVSINSLISPLLFAKIIDDGVYQKRIDITVIYLLIVLILSLFGTLINIFINQQFGRIRESFILYVKRYMLMKINMLDGKKLNTFPPGKIFNVFEFDVEQISMIVTDHAYSILFDICTFIGACAIMLIFDYRIFILSIIFGIALLILNRIFGKKIYAMRTKESIISDEQIINEQEYINNLSYNLQTNNFAYHENRTMKQEAKKQRLAYQINLVEIFNIESGSVFQSIALALTWLFGGIGVIKSKMTLGNLTAMVSYASKTWSPLLRLSEASILLKELEVSLERLNDVLQTDDTTQVNGKQKPSPTGDSSICFTDVSFSYHPSQKILQNLNLNIAPKKINAIVGKSGEGKSTIIRLLTKLWKNDRGTISIGGEDINFIQTNDLRNNISLVPQEPVIFNDTLRNNLCLDKVLEDEHLIELLSLLNLTELLSQLEHGLDSMLDPNGNNLSGGEKHRIAFARALCDNTPIIVLDEPTSNLDIQNKKQIEQMIVQNLKGKTVILITHDMQLVGNAHVVNFLKDGKIIAAMSQEEFKKQNSMYQYFFEEE